MLNYIIPENWMEGIKQGEKYIYCTKYFLENIFQGF